jgi:hypothetical protein
MQRRAPTCIRGLDDARRCNQHQRVIDALKGKVLTGVEFTMGYVQLDFAGSRLTCWVWPTVAVDGEVARHMGDLGYRDALCALLSREVVGADESLVDGPTVSFANGSVAIRPQQEDLTGPEIAMLQLHDVERRWDVWRPGEGPFEDLA